MCIPDSMDRWKRIECNFFLAVRIVTMPPDLQIHRQPKLELYERWDHTKWTVFLLPAKEVWGKVIFSQASVCPQQGDLPDRDPPQTENPRRETLWTETPPSRTPKTETPWTETLPAYRKSKQYTCYWNAFLFSYDFVNYIEHCYCS